MLASFVFLGVSIRFTGEYKLGFVLQESEQFSEVWRILLGGEFVHGIISIIEMSTYFCSRKMSLCYN